MALAISLTDFRRDPCVRRVMRPRTRDELRSQAGPGRREEAPFQV